MIPREQNYDIMSEITLKRNSQKGSWTQSGRASQNGQLTLFPGMEHLRNAICLCRSGGTRRRNIRLLSSCPPLQGAWPCCARPSGWTYSAAASGLMELSSSERSLWTWCPSTLSRSQLSPVLEALTSLEIEVGPVEESELISSVNPRASAKHRARKPRNLTHELSQESAHEIAHGRCTRKCPRKRPYEG